MQHFGVTTINHWLSEKLPPGVTAYVEHTGRLFELLRVVATNGKLIPEIRSRFYGGLGGFAPRDTYVNLNTLVILAVDENLAGVPMTSIEAQLPSKIAVYYERGWFETLPTD